MTECLEKIPKTKLYLSLEDGFVFFCFVLFYMSDIHSPRRRWRFSLTVKCYLFFQKVFHKY